MPFRGSFHASTQVNLAQRQKPQEENSGYFMDNGRDFNDLQRKSDSAFDDEIDAPLQPLSSRDVAREDADVAIAEEASTALTRTPEMRDIDWNTYDLPPSFDDDFGLTGDMPSQLPPQDISGTNMRLSW